MWRAAVADILPISFQKIGRWWGNNKKEKREEEIDFVAYAYDSAIFGECKWTNERVNKPILEELIRKSELFPHFKSKYYMMFSKVGFDNNLMEQIKHGSVKLKTLGDLYVKL